MLTIALALAAAAALVLVWARVVQTLTARVERKPPIGEPRSIVWGDRVFTSDRQLKAFLDGKGLSYSRWVSQHPSAFAIIRHNLPESAAESAPRAAVLPGHSRRRGAPAPAHKSRRLAATASLAAADASSRPAWLAVVTGLFIVAGSMVAASAVVPSRLAPVLVTQFYRLPGRRVVAVAFGAALVGTSLEVLYL